MELAGNPSRTLNLRSKIVGCEYIVITMQINANSVSILVLIVSRSQFDAVKIDNILLCTILFPIFLPDTNTIIPVFVVPGNTLITV